MHILKTTPIFYLENIEQVLPFWQERLGYKLLAEVPHGSGLGFAILARDNQEVMLQTFASAEHDLPEMAKRLRKHSTAFFHEVDSIDDAIALLEGVEVVGGPRTAAYGMREIFVVDSEGWVHGWAERVSS